MHIDLTQGDIRQHLKTLAIPASIGFFFHTLFNVTDTYFAGLISTQALAALSISFPIFFIIISVAGGMAEAVTALVGNALGEGDRAKAQHIVHNALVFGVILAVLLTLLGLGVSSWLMQQVGADGVYLKEALAYINVIILGSGLFVFVFFINAMLNAVGDTVSFRNVLMVSAVLNVILDYWFVSGGLGVPALGVSGIAFATVLIEALSAFYLWYRLSKTPLMKEMCAFEIKKTTLVAFTHQGVPPSFNMALTAMGIYIITYFASPYGQDVIAAYGIGMRVEQMVLMPLIGLNVAVLAIVSQNNGAQAYERIRQSVNVALRYALALALLGGVILLGASEMLMGLFSDDPSVIYEGSRYLRVEALLVYPFAVIFIYVALLQGIKRPNFIMYLSVIRQIIAPLALLSVLVGLELDVISLWVGIALIVTVAAMITRWYARRELSYLHEDWLLKQR